MSLPGRLALLDTLNNTMILMHGNSMMSKMIVEFFLGLKANELQQFVYACIFKPVHWLMWIIGIHFYLICTYHVPQ